MIKRVIIFKVHNCCFVQFYGLPLKVLALSKEGVLLETLIKEALIAF